MVCLQIIIGTSNILLNGDKAMKAKYLIATLILIALFFSHCDNSPTAPQSRTTTTSIKLYANCVHDGEPYFLKLFYWSVSGWIVNIGNTTARNVRITYNFYDYQNQSKIIKQITMYTSPTSLSPGQKGRYYSELSNLPSRFYYNYTIKWD
jgi:hypothetical protein